MAPLEPQRDLLQDESFAEVRVFLEERGIPLEDEQAILGAIRDRGWELEVEGEPGDWTVKIRDCRAATQYQVAIAQAPNRWEALRRSLRLALSWLTPEEGRAAFDRQTRELMGISGEAFMRRWGTSELPTDDPRVAHLMLLRPLTSLRR